MTSMQPLAHSQAQPLIENAESASLSDRDRELREHYTQARDAAQRDFEAAQVRCDEIQTQLSVAREAQRQRLEALAAARQEAQAATTAQLTAGHSEASEDEQRAAYAQWRIDQEAARASAALAEMEAQLAAAVAERTRCSSRWAEADNAAQLHERQIGANVLLAEWIAADALLADLAARTRAFNDAGRALGQQLLARQGGAVSAIQQRSAGGLCLPGQKLDSARLDLRASAAAGYVLRLAPDLTTAQAFDGHTVWHDLAGAIERGRVAE